VIRAEEILEFWFGRPDDPEFETGRAVWFKPSRAFDAEIRARFLDDYEAARNGAYDGWQGAAPSCLALIVMLDQFPRNLFRDSARSYECDEKALSVARQAISHGFDRELRPVERSFVYLPFEHAENLAAQRDAVALFRGLAAHARGAEWLEYAERHMRIIERFGRFPHRNAVLGRPSTAEEIEFLKDPASTFLRAATD
jgi:uncharacterized protein (DUF924 family)